MENENKPRSLYDELLEHMKKQNKEKKGDEYPSIGRNGSYITDKKGALNYFKNLKKGDTVTISSSKASKIERDLGLESGSLLNGFKVREVSGISSMHPSPVHW